MKLENFDEFQNQMQISPKDAERHLVDRLNSFNKELQQIKFKKNDIRAIYLAQYERNNPGQTAATFQLIDTDTLREYKQHTQKLENRIKKLNDLISDIKEQLRAKHNKLFF